jgi:hypothetical protein
MHNHLPSLKQNSGQAQFMIILKKSLFKAVIFFLSFFSVYCNAQPVKLIGKLTNKNYEPLSFASVQIKELQLGTLTNDVGVFEIKIPEGKYDIVISLIGYTTKSFTIILDKPINNETFMLFQKENYLKETTIYSVKKDNAREIIEQVIKNKEKQLYTANSYNCSVYIKAKQQDSTIFKKRNNKIKKSNKTEKIDSNKLNINADSLALIKMIKIANDSLSNYYNSLAMSELIVRLDWQYPNKIKETKTAVKKYGPSRNLFFLSTTDGDFNFLKNSISIPALSQVPFVSPFSYSGLLAYKFKLISIYNRNGNKYYKIKVSPIKLGNALISGIVEIMDSSWVLKSAYFEFPKFHMPEYDFFSITQNYEKVDSFWIIANQDMIYYAKFNKGKLNGSTKVSYTNFTFNVNYKKNYFTNEVGITLDSAYSYNQQYWQKNRPEPLSTEELKYVLFKDSVYNARHSKHYLDSVDRLTNKINFKKIVWDGLTFYNRDKERTFYIGPMLSMYRPFFLGGARIANNNFFVKKFDNKKSIYLSSDLSFGLINKDLLGSITLGHLYNPFNRGRISFSIGKNFELINYNDAWINLLQRGNYYLNTRGTITHSIELYNGLWMSNWAEMSIRKSVSNYKINALSDSLLGNVLTNNKIFEFESYNALYNNIKIEYTPFQKYLHEPKQKIILGSKYPTIYCLWRKGINGLLKSQLDFDYIEFGLYQKKLIGTAGILNYNLMSGKFLNTRQLPTIDKKFIRRGDPIFFSNPTRNFQSMDSSFAINNWFYEAHLVHDFNGSILNKIPLIKKLKMLEVAGAGLLYLPERNLKYAEVFLGLEKTFRFAKDKYKIGVYIVGAKANSYTNPIQFKIGLEQYNKTKNSW